jgi:translation initiation factor 2 beta subunit (eIF-2beta)/eIF-5
MIMPNMELLSVGFVALCICSVLTRKDQREKRTLKCKKCGTKEMRARAGMIICKNGHKVTSQE